jgi:hypothetical protein
VSGRLSDGEIGLAGRLAEGETEVDEEPLSPVLEARIGALAWARKAEAMFRANAAEPRETPEQVRA